MPEQLDDAELRHRLERAMRMLPRLTRELFLAHRLDGMPYAEIAQRTGLSVREVERQMARAIIAIDRSLNGPPLRWLSRR
jgi:RNA polymerase sigma factor (sigma-70 family)